jgi:hypothetical protein
VSVPTTADLYSIAHGPKAFVVVGTGGVVMWSRDGLRWSLDRSVTSLNLHTVAWTGRVYTAGGDRGKLLTSTDGRRWGVVKRYPGYHAVRAIAANGGAIGLAGTGTVARNAAGGRWLLEPIGFQHFWTAVAYGAGVFVIVGHNGTELLSGDAGLTWVPVTTTAAVNLDAVAWTGTEFVATGQGTAVASPDGTNWQAIPVKSRYSVRALALFEGHLIGVGDQRTIVQVS